MNFDNTFNTLCKNTDISTAVATMFDHLPEDFWSKRNLHELVKISCYSIGKKDIQAIALMEISSREAEYSEWVNVEPIIFLDDKLANLIFSKRTATATTFKQLTDTGIKYLSAKLTDKNQELALSKMVEFATSFSDWSMIFIYASNNKDIRNLATEKLYQLATTVDHFVTINHHLPNKETFDQVVDFIESSGENNLETWSRIYKAIGVSQELRDHALSQITKLSD